MALESKPLFHPEVLRQQVRSFNLPDQTVAWLPKLQEWARLITSGRADEFKESELLADGDANGAEKRSEALISSVAVEHLKCRRREEEFALMRQIAPPRMPFPPPFPS